MFINTQVYNRKELVLIFIVYEVYEEIISTFCDSEILHSKTHIVFYFCCMCNRFAYL